MTPKKLPLTLITLFIFTFSFSQTTLVEYSSSWHYYDNGNAPTAQGSLNWYDSNYDDNGWLSNNAQLGYGDGDEATILNNVLTAYFRYSFDILDHTVLNDLDFNLLHDDGAVVYLNGVEVWRVNMPTGNIDYNTFASSGSQDNQLTSAVFPNTLVTGINVLAIEVHQKSSSSSDLSFDFELKANPSGNVNVTRGPYLQKASETSMVVHWRTNTAAESVIRFGTSLTNLDQFLSDPNLKTNHSIEITGLNPNTEYYYQIEDLQNVIIPKADDLYFKTSPNVGAQQTVKAWILGDCGTATGNARAVRDAYYNYIGSNHTDMILFLGDNAYSDGTDDQYQMALFENMYENKLKNTVAWSCMGNHDGYSANSNTQTGPYYDIFNFPTAGESGGVASGTEAYYSFDYGNIHFISLDSYDSDNSVGGSMYTWCESDIQNTTAEWIVAFWHHPPYSKGSHDSDAESALSSMRENIVPMLENNGVDLILSGHSHSYERSYFLNGHYGEAVTFDSNTHTIGNSGFGDGRNDGNGPYEKETIGPEAGKGAVYVVTGSAGKKSDAPLDHDAMYYSVAELGSCLLEVNGNQMDVRFLRDTNTVTFEDYFTIIKDGTPCEPENDEDMDGVCDIYDQCPNQDDNMIGTSCDDNNPCTINDIYNNSCTCAGTVIDADGDGVCFSEDPDDNDGCNPNPNSEACDPCSDLISDSFETGFGNWTDGGNDCARVSSNPNSGSYSIRLRDDSGANGAMTSDPLDLTNFDDNVKFEFSYFPVSMEPYEDFFLEISTDGGSNYTIYQSWVSGTDFNNDTRYDVSLDINGISFSSNTVFRIRCDASGNNDLVYVDDVVVRTCNSCTAGLECDDGNPETSNDVTTSSCECVGEYDCPLIPGNIGAPCDDGNPATSNDVITSNCECVGEYDCPSYPANIGDSCDDGDSGTYDDTIDLYCNCVGILYDCPTIPANIGDTCDDGNPETANDMITSICICEGSYDCPSIPSNIGDSCDDGDPCTSNDVYNNSCTCVGTYIDADGDGVCFSEDLDDQDPCVPDINAPTCNTCTTETSDDFEVDFGNWNDGGNDCARVATNANSGSYSIRLRDNSGVSSSIFTDDLDLSAYNETQIDFSFYATSMEDGEDLILEYSLDGGSTFNQVQNWVAGTNFENNNRYFESVTISNVTFTTTTQFRLLCDASANNDQIYIDDINIIGCGINPNTIAILDDGLNAQTADLEVLMADSDKKNIKPLDIEIFPNPTTGQLFIDTQSPSYNRLISIYGIHGKLIFQQKFNELHHGKIKLDLSQFQDGIYMLHLNTSDNQFAIKKFVIMK